MGSPNTFHSQSFKTPTAIMAAVNAYPPGGTFLDTLKVSFTNVPVDKEKDNAVATTEFLEAAESLTTLFDVLGSMAFNPVKGDMLGNVKKIRERQLAAPAESTTLQDLVINELKTKKHTATEGWSGFSRTRLHLHSPLAESRPPHRRTRRLLPQRLRQHPQPPPFPPDQAGFLSRYERLSLPQGLLY